MRDWIISALAAVVYYAIILALALFAALVTGPALAIHRLYLWAHKHADLEYKRPIP